MKFNVMIVDDSKRVLESIQWLFTDEPYYLFTFDNPIDALRVINALDWSVVIVDRSIRKMDGLEFLKKIKADSPHTMGIIMGEHADITKEIDESYSECVYRFVHKPIIKNEIKQAVKTAITYYETEAGSKKHANSK